MTYSWSSQRSLLTSNAVSLSLLLLHAAFILSFTIPGWCKAGWDIPTVQLPSSKYLNRPACVDLSPSPFQANNNNTISIYIMSSEHVWASRVEIQLLEMRTFCGKHCRMRFPTDFCNSHAFWFFFFFLPSPSCYGYISQLEASWHFQNGALLVGRRQICLDREMLQSYSWVWKTSMEDCHNRDQSSWELHLYSSWNGQCHDRWAWS